MALRRALPRLVMAMLAASCAFAPRPSAAFEATVQPSGLDDSQQRAATALVDDVVARLPDAWRAALPSQVRIAFTDALPDDVHGRARGREVLLRRTLLDDVPAPSAPHPAAVALVHELAHLYDRSPAGGMSRDPRLLDLAGWRRRALGGRTRDSLLRDRSGDDYERAHPREFVAVNLERFVFDAEFACRRPALQAYFARRLQVGTQPMPCPAALPFVQMDARADAALPALVELDPARVAGVDYLLAEPGDAPMSRWGHGMLRLIVCAPHRAPGPDCRLDLEHHRVLSFRAFVDDLQVSGWRGLAGAYPSRLFVLPLTQVVDEYTRVELRGLRSVPLALGHDGIARLLERAAQLHWSYDGRYYFVSNNCAVETWRLLHESLPGLPAMHLARLTPTGLLRALGRDGIADASVMNDAAEARRRGHAFDSQRAHYQAMFDVARAQLELPAADVDGWLRMAPDARAPWLERADLRAAAALLLLEDAALRREEQAARVELLRSLLSQAPDAPGLERASEALHLAERLSRPAALAPDGYGLPQSAERAQLDASAAALALQWRDTSTRLSVDARAWLSPSRRARLEGAERNMGALGERLRELHRAQGGMRLDAPGAAPH